MNDVVELTGLPSGMAEALASGALRDPFAVLGPSIPLLAGLCAPSCLARSK